MCLNNAIYSVEVETIEDKNIPAQWILHGDLHPPLLLVVRNGPTFFFRKKLQHKAKGIEDVYVNRGRLGLMPIGNRFKIQTL